MYYEWTDIESFNKWHNALCEELGYPLTSVNQATGLPDETAQMTVRFVNPIIVENKVVAFLTEHNEGLIPSDYQPPIWNFEYGNP